MSDGKWLVSKFGGSSLADASCFRRVADILADGQQNRHAVVVSAVKGVTDTLVGCLDLAELKAEVSRAIACKSLGMRAGAWEHSLK